MASKPEERKIDHDESDLANEDLRNKVEQNTLEQLSQQNPVPVTAKLLKPLPLTAESLGSPKNPSSLFPKALINIPKKIKCPFYFEILEYILNNNLTNKSLLYQGTKIQIMEKFFYFNINGLKNENIAHQNKLQFGREGHVNFEGSDPTISRKQFEIILKENSAEIVCHCTPPKLPTSFLITEESFYLSKDNIISFGKQGDYIFYVSYFNKKEIGFQPITFAKEEERLKGNEVNVLKNNRGCILGSFPPLNIPFIKNCNIRIEYDNEKSQWYVKNDKFKNNENNFGSPYETYVWIFNIEKFPFFNSELPTQLESSAIELKENMIINTGGCYLKVKSGRI